MRIWDAHCHLQENVNWKPLLTRLLETPSRGWCQLEGMLLMGTRPSDWPLVEAIHTTFPDHIRPCYGLHPWFVHHLPLDCSTPSESVSSSDSKSEWLNDLLGRLKRDPHSLVGEFGLDKVAVVPQHLSEEQTFVCGKQQPVFHQQMEAAVSLNRPVSLHGVQTYGYLLDYFRLRAAQLPPQRAMRRMNTEERRCRVNSLCPPAVMLHSYSGSVETMRQLTQLRGLGDRFYFSFSSVIHGRWSALKRQELLKSVPPDRVLVESDLGQVQEESIYWNQLKQISEWLAQAKGWTLEETCERTRMNTLSYLGLVDSTRNRC